MSQRSSLKVWVFLSLVSVTLMFAGQRLAERHGLLIGFLIALAVNAAIFFYGEIRLLKRFPSELLEGQDPWGLISRLEALSAKAAIPVPRLFLVSVQTPITFSVGMSSGQSAVLVSEGLVRELAIDEIEAALAFEVARLKRQDTAASTAAVAITSGLNSLANALDQILFFQFLRRRRPAQLRPAAFLLSPLIALLARIAVGRRQFMESDKLAAQLINDPERMARVLWKLHSFQNTRPFDAAPSDTPLFVVNPLTSCFWYRYLQVQPSVERRIRLLIGHYPV